MEQNPRPVRLQKILSTAGVASRRASEKLIAEGRVSVNGEVVTEMGARADPARDDIRVDGRRVSPSPPRRYLLLHKPRGYVTTRADPEGRPTVMDLLGATGDYLYPVGRLDYDSEGLLLLTNDGDLAARLMHPRHEVEREYEVHVRGDLDARTLDRLSRGIVIEGRRTAPATVRLAPSASRPGRTVFLIVLHEGRSRQIRKMCESVGHPVTRLRRLRIGPIADPALAPGEVRALTPAEVQKLKRAATGVDVPRPKDRLKAER